MFKIFFLKVYLENIDCSIFCLDFSFSLTCNDKKSLLDNAPNKVGIWMRYSKEINVSKQL